MATVYSAPFAIAHGLSGDSSAYVVPSDVIWVIREMDLYNGNLLEVVTASVTIVGGITVWSQTWEASPGSRQWQGRIVLEPSSGFFQLHATFPVDFYVGGYSLTAP